jgi:hypothetical protein
MPGKVADPAVQVCHVRREPSVAAKLGKIGPGFVDENIVPPPRLRV